MRSFNRTIRKNVSVYEYIVPDMNRNTYIHMKIYGNVLIRYRSRVVNWYDYNTFEFTIRPIINRYMNIQQLSMILSEYVEGYDISL